MPRTTTARKTFDDSPRERLLSVASELFYAHGIRNVGIDEIIARAGVAKASLYRHFPSKDDLVTEVLRQRDAAWFRDFRADVEARASNPKKRLLAVFAVLEDWFAEDLFRGCAFMNAAIELADATHPAHGVSRDHKRRMRAYLAELAKAARLKEPGALADQLALLIEGAIVTAVLEQSPEPARRARAAAVRLIAAH